MSLYSKALKIALNAHDGQTRKQSCVPYIVHPIRVAGYFNDDIRKSIAVLHDTIEDTDLEIMDLWGLFPKEVIDAIFALTRKDEEFHFPYIERVKKNELATEVKIADIVDNLSDTLCPLSEGMSKRYKKSLEILIK